MANTRRRRFRRWKPSPLTVRVVLRVPGAGVVDRYGRTVTPAHTDTSVWVAVRDGRSIQRGLSGVPVERRFSTYAIRERGGIGDGRVQRYLELDCVRVGNGKV